MVRRGAGRSVALGSTSNSTRSVTASRADRGALTERRCRRSAGAVPLGRDDRPDRHRCSITATARRRCAGATPRRTHRDRVRVCLAATATAQRRAAATGSLDVCARVEPAASRSRPEPVPASSRRGGGAAFDSGVEIVSGAGAPKWNQRTHTREWSDSPPVVASATPAVVFPIEYGILEGRRKQFVRHDSILCRAI